MAQPAARNAASRASSLALSMTLVWWISLSISTMSLTSRRR